MAYTSITYPCGLKLESKQIAFVFDFDFTGKSCPMHGVGCGKGKKIRR